MQTLERWMLLVSWLQSCNVLKKEPTCQASSINEVIMCVYERQKLNLQLTCKNNEITVKMNVNFAFIIQCEGGLEAVGST